MLVRIPCTAPGPLRDSPMTVICGLDYVESCRMRIKVHWYYVPSVMGRAVTLRLEKWHGMLPSVTLPLCRNAGIALKEKFRVH